MTLYSIVVPVYNSEQSLEILYNRIRSVFEKEIREPFELILVDDCSSDQSYKIIRHLSEADPRVKGIQLAVNHGQQKAVLCGFHYVEGDFVITMDDALQHPPEQIPVLIEKMNSSDDIDVVIGSYDVKKHGPIRRFGSWLMNLSSNIIYGKPNKLKLTSFRLIKRYVVDNLNRISISQPTVGPLLLQTTKRIVNTQVHHDQRQFGHSGYSFGKLVTAFFRNMVTNSDLPLKFVRDIGVFSLLMSFLLILRYLIRYFVRGTSIAGWTTTVILLLFFGGMMLFSIGLVGRYLTSIMLEAKKYPAYLIRQEDIRDISQEKIESGNGKETMVSSGNVSNSQREQS